MDPMSNIEEPLVQTCPSCGAEIDVSEQEPLSAIICPVCGAPSVVAATIDHFELLDELGRGGMGVVYRAQDTSLDRPVALKLLRKSETTGPEQIAQLETEAAITASINHPHVVKVFTTGMDHGRFYIAMELVDKGTLDSLIELQGRVAEAQVLEVGIQIASGLRAAHQAGLIHRDVKPGNILFSDAHTAKIVDFGLAIFLEDEASKRGEIWGTPYYVAPEKLDNKPEDFRSDIYSLGGTLFHALAGRPPFEAENASMVALKHLKSQAVSLQTFAPWVSSSTSYVINKTLSKDPDQRYQSYDELIEHLEYARTEFIASGGKPQEAKRVVIETEQATKTMGLLVFGMIGIIVALGISAFVFRDKIFKGEETPAAETQKTDKMFPEACAKLAEGDAAAASAAFRAAGGQPNLQQPRLNWVNLLEGLSELAAGQGADSYATFKQIQERGRFSKKPEDQALATFFLTTAQHMTDEGPIAPSVARGADGKTYEAIIPLLYGMKDWEQGKVEDAMTLLRQFRQAAPAGNDAWIAQLTPFATAYIEEYTAYQMATDRYKAAKSFMEKKTAVAGLKQIKGRFAKPVAPLLAKGAAEVAAEEKKRAQLLAAGKIPPDVYKLVNRKSGKVIDVEGRSKDDGHKLQQWGYSGANNEKWKVVPLEDGFYQIISVDSGKALNVPQAQTDDGSALTQATPAKEPSQHWKIEKTDGNFYKLTAQSSGKTLAIGGDLAKDGSPIVQTAYTGAPEQQWKLDLP
jgi:eukaryotic-like serine/threonine-protein kinase